MAPETNPHMRNKEANSTQNTALLRKYGLLTIATAFSAAGQFVIVWSIARIKGVSPLGLYGLVTSLTYLAQTLFLSGLQPLVMLGVSRGNNALGRSLGTALVGVTISGALLSGLVVILSKILGYSPYVTMAVAVASAAMIPDAIRSVVEWTAVAQNRIRYVVIITVGSTILQITAVEVVLLTQGALLRVFGVITCISALVAFLYLRLLISWVRPNRLGTTPAELVDWARSTIPFLGFGASGALSRRLDVPLLNQLGGFDATGIYTASLKLIKPFILMRPVLFQTFFPPFVRQFDSSTERSLRTARSATRLSSFLLSALALATVAWASPLVFIVYGAEFAPTVQALQVMIWGVPAFYSQTLASSILFADNREKTAAWIHVIDLVAEIGLSFVLVPIWGTMGMAIVYVAIRTLGIAQACIVLRKHHSGLQLGKAFFGPVLLAAPLALLLALSTRDISYVAQVAAGIAAVIVYSLAAVAAGLVSKKDLALLRLGQSQKPNTSSGSKTREEIPSLMPNSQSDPGETSEPIPPCPLCRKRDVQREPEFEEFLGYPSTHPIVRCTACGMVYATQRPSVKTIDAFYSSRTYDVDAYLRRSRVLERMQDFERIYAKLEEYLPNKGSLLEVGCAAGYFLSVGRERGWQVQGIDASTQLATYAQVHLGLDVQIATTLQQANLDPGAIDVIYAEHVLEHLSNPVQMLEEAKKVLRKGGYLVVTVPNELGEIRYTMRKSLFHKYAAKMSAGHRLDIGHVNFFTLSTMLKMIEQAGFVPIFYSTWGVAARQTMLRGSSAFKRQIKKSLFTAANLFAKGPNIEVFAVKPDV